MTVEVLPIASCARERPSQAPALMHVIRQAAFADLGSAGLHGRRRSL